jgi:NitT/TauT family transport system substrate-binding protein
MRTLPKILGLSVVLVILGCTSQDNKNGRSGGDARNEGGKPQSVRLGYFPNITHAQAILGVSRGVFAKELEPGAKLETVTFNAGPSVIEAIFGGKLDIAYVGPSPTLNGFIKSEGEEVRLIAGSATNGVLIVGNKKLGITSLDQLNGKRIASPQLGNTQDISAKDFVINHLKSTLKEKGGDTAVIPIANPDIETLFQKNQLEAAWVPEPWGSRLIDKELGVLISEEKELWPGKTFALTNIIARRKFLENHPDLVKKILSVHVKLTKELQQDPQRFATELNAELKRLTQKDLPPAVIEGSLKYTGFSTDPARDSIQEFFRKGKSLGLLKAETFDVDKLVDTRLLSEVTAKEANAETTSSQSLATQSVTTTETRQ